MFSYLSYLAALIASLVLAIYALTKRELTETGTVAAIMAGATVFAFGGWVWFALMFFFFVSSSAFTHYKEKAKKKVAREFDKGGVRDFWQVAANGLAPAGCALLYALNPSPAFFAAFAAAVAAVNADTWATELGVLAESKPRLLTTLRRVPKGTSGAVSSLGLGVALGGSLFVALSAASLAWLNNYFAPLLAASPLAQLFPVQPAAGLAFVLVVTVAGVTGSLVDSILGALVQRMHWCPKCRKLTEREVHTCGTRTEFRQGLRWVDNDVVNFLSAVAAAATAVGLTAAL